VIFKINAGTSLGERYKPANLVIFGWTHFAVYKSRTNALFLLCTAYCVACEQALKLNWEPASQPRSQGLASMTNKFEYLPRNVRFSKYGMSILNIWCCLQLSCKLSLDRTVYTVFRNIRCSIQAKVQCFKYCFLKTEHFVLWDKMAKTNLIS
jgi:hypothetical protein